MTNEARCSLRVRVGSRCIQRCRPPQGSTYRFRAPRYRGRHAGFISACATARAHFLSELRDTRKLRCAEQLRETHAVGHLSTRSSYRFASQWPNMAFTSLPQLSSCGPTNASWVNGTFLGEDVHAKFRTRQRWNALSSNRQANDS